MAVWSEITSKLIAEADRIDGEYFSPQYILNEKLLCNLLTKQLPELFYISDGNHLGVSQYFNEDPSYISYFRGQDINDFFLENASPIRIPETIFLKSVMKRSHFYDGDVLLSIVGTIGKLSIVTRKIGNATGSCKIAILRGNGKMSPYFLAAFLLSRPGQLQIQRNTRGAVQMGLILKDMSRIRIPVIAKNAEKTIEQKIKNSIELNRKSQALYTQAQQLLEHELGLDKLKFEKPVGFETSFSEVVNNNRVDADYYQTKFRSLEKHIRNINTKPLSQIANFTKGIEVGSSAYTDEGKLFLRVSNVKKTGIKTGSSDKYINNNLFSSLQIFQPEINELLLTKDGTPGICYVVDEIIDGIISGGIVKIKIINTSIPSEYLALVINSKICRMQVERVCSGALIVHWKPGDISKLQIPILSDGMMKKLSKLVAKSKQVKRESQQLLNQAKTRVEQLIEEAAGKNE